MATIRERIQTCVNMEDGDGVMSLVDEIEDAVNDILSHLTINTLEDVTKLPEAYSLTEKLKEELY